MVEFLKKEYSTSFVSGFFAIILAAFLWSLDSVLIRPNLYQIPVFLLVFLEHFLGFIVLSPFLILGFKKIKNLSKQVWVAIFWICFFGGLIGTFAITQAFFLAFGGGASLSTIVIVQKLQPIFALFLASFLLKEKLNKNFYFWSSLAILSALIITVNDLGGVNFFNSASFFALLAAFGFGSSTVFGKRVVNKLDYKLTASLRFLITSVLALICSFIFGGFYSINSVSEFQWVLLLLIVFTSGASALFLYYFGLKRVSASSSTIFELFFPFSAVVLDYFFNGNILTIPQIIFSVVLIFCFFKITRTKKIEIKKNYIT